jgi:hypothetical protein
MIVPVKATVMWAYLTKINDMSGKYQVDLCHLSEKAVAALEEIGLKTMHKEDKGNYITCKSKNTIKVYDDRGKELDGGSIGNGSECIATLSAYEWSFKGKKGVSASLKKLKVTMLVEYIGAGGAADGFDESDVL